MEGKLSFQEYGVFEFRFTARNGIDETRLGVICVAINDDREIGKVLATITGSACSVSEPKFIANKGEKIAVSRAECPRSHVRKFKCTLDESVDIHDVMDVLKLRPSCEYMDDATVAATDKRWDALCWQRAQKDLDFTFEFLRSVIEVGNRNDELESIKDAQTIQPHGLEVDENSEDVISLKTK